MSGTGQQFDQLMVFDWNSTLGYPGIKESFFRKYGLIPQSQFDLEFDAYNTAHGITFDSSSEIRTARLDYLFKRLKDGTARDRNFVPKDHLFRKADGARPDGQFCIADMEQFGIKGEVYDGAEEMLSRLKATVASGQYVFPDRKGGDSKRITKEGQRLGIAVVTNAWAPIVRNTPIVTSGVVDVVVGQEFHDVSLGGRTLAKPEMGVGADTKPGALLRLSRQFGVPMESMFYAGNGYSDIQALRFVKENGGRTLGIIRADRLHVRPGKPMTKRQKKHEREDLKVLKKLLAEGVVDFIADADFSPGSRIERLLTFQSLRTTLAAEQRTLEVVMQSAIPTTGPITERTISLRFD